MIKTKLFALLCAALLLGSLAGCASAVPPETKPAAESAPAATVPETEPQQPVTPSSAAVMLEDFTVPTIDGGSFTLSKALQDHELVLINLWATWCPPCAMEFPFLQEAWSQRSDTVAVIALSVEPEDSDEVLRDYAAEKGLTFPIGNADGTELNRFVTEGIPTSILVDRTGRVADVEVGAKQSTEEFFDLFDAYTGEDYDPSLCTYTVFAYDAVRFDGVEGVVVNFCTDTTCTPVTSTEQGKAVFTGPPAEYHVQIVRSPEGWQPGAATEWDTEIYGQTFLVPFTETGK